MLLILRKMAQCLLKHVSPAKVRQVEAKVIKQQGVHLIPQETLAQCNKHCNNKKSNHDSVLGRNMEETHASTSAYFNDKQCTLKHCAVVGAQDMPKRPY